MPNPVLDRQLQEIMFMLVGLGLIGLALYLRLRIFIGTRPGGVDTWYYLASAEAIRRHRRLPISLPQYLLHDKTESYPAVFPLFLALLSPAWLRAYFWLVSPIIDAVQLLLLYVLALRLTDSVLAAGIAGFIYAVTPQLISETRNLNGRAFASLLLTIAMLTLLRSIIPSEGPLSGLLGPGGRALWVVAVLLIGVLYNTHTSTTIAMLVSLATLSIVFGEPRFLLAGVVGLPMAIVISGGYYVRVIANHVHAARFWLRNVEYTRAHQIDDSPLFAARNHVAAAAQGLYRSPLTLGLRVLGENPFIVAMLVAPIPDNVWAVHMYWWAVAILIWSVLTTFGGPLRILGPGFHYMKASVFPSAYTLAVTVNMREGGLTGFDVMLLTSFLASFGALAYFFRYMDMRRTEQTAQTPPDLAAATDYLRTQPEGAVLVLPNMFADFVMYNACRAVVWGGHSGNLGRLEEFFPVIRRPLGYFFERYNVAYLVLDLQYTTLERLQIDDATELLEQFGSIGVYEVRTRAGPLEGTDTPSLLARSG